MGLRAYDAYAYGKPHHRAVSDDIHHLAPRGHANHIRFIMFEEVFLYDALGDLALWEGTQLKAYSGDLTWAICIIASLKLSTAKMCVRV